MAEEEVAAVVAHNESGMCTAVLFAGDNARRAVPFEISMWLKPHPENNCGIAVEGDALWPPPMERKPPSSPSSSESIDASALK